MLEILIIVVVDLPCNIANFVCAALRKSTQILDL